MGDIPLKVLIVDSDKRAARALADTLSKVDAVIRVEVCTALRDAGEALATLDINVIYIDPISLGIEGTSDFIFQTRNRYPAIVFVLYYDAEAPGRPQDKAPKLTEPKDLFKEVCVQGGGVALAGDAALALVPLDQAESQPADQPQVHSRLAVGHLVVVLPERDVEHPVAAVLYPPVPAQGPRVAGRRHVPAADEVVLLVADLAAHLPLAQAQPDRREVGPLVLLHHPVQVVQHHVLPALLAAVPLLLDEAVVVAPPLPVALEGPAEQPVDVPPQPVLVALDRQHVVAALLDYLGRDRLLRPHRVDGHQRAAQLQQAEQLGDGGDLVGLLTAGDAAEAEADLAGPGADQVQGAQAVACPAGAAQGLAVDGDVLDAEALGQGGGPTGQAAGEGAGGGAAHRAAA